jgi:SEC-C motif
MSRIRRNQPCPCGSGAKYKRCCGAVSPLVQLRRRRVKPDELPPEVRRALIENQRRKNEEKAIYGHARPMVSIEHHGYRFVAVRNRLQYSKKWKTPIDFFGDYIKNVLGADGWGNGDIAKPYRERHPILQWYHDVCLWQRKHHDQGASDGVYSGVATGSAKAYYALAYDLWTLDNDALLQDKLVRRLKNADQFQGARYELYVIASMIRAGFDVELEDESDSSKTHCELTATHRKTGRKMSVEAKSTSRPGILGRAGERPSVEEIKTYIYRKLQEALLKNADYDRVVFIDVNMPPDDAKLFQIPWFAEASRQLKRLEDSQSADDPYPPAFVFFTNHPYHYVGNDDVEPGQTAFFTGINQDELKSATEIEDQAAAEALAQGFEAGHPEIKQLVDSVFNHTRIPNTF